MNCGTLGELDDGVILLLENIVDAVCCQLHIVSTSTQQVCENSTRVITDQRVKISKTKSYSTCFHNSCDPISEYHGGSRISYFGVKTFSAEVEQLQKSKNK